MSFRHASTPVVPAYTGAMDRTLLEPGVSRPTPRQPGLWLRLLDGPHRWGAFSATVGRYGVRYDRMVIYPPGISTADRRLARMWRAWPVSGAALGLMALIFLGQAATPPAEVLEFVVAAYVSIGALLFLRAGPARVPVRTLSAVLVPPASHAGEQRRHSDWERLVQALTQADRLLALGAISRVEYEAIWWEAYGTLEPAPHG